MAEHQITESDLRREVEALRTRRRLSANRAVMDPDLPDLHTGGLRGNSPSLGSGSNTFPSNDQASCSEHLANLSFEHTAHLAGSQPLFGSIDRDRILARRQASAGGTARSQTGPESSFPPMEQHHAGGSTRVLGRTPLPPTPPGPNGTDNLFWIPASAHPEISPENFRSFLKTQAERNVNQHAQEQAVNMQRSPPNSPPMPKTSPTMLDAESNAKATTDWLIGKSTSLARRSSSLRRQYNGFDEAPARERVPEDRGQRRGSLLAVSDAPLVPAAHQDLLPEYHLVRELQHREQPAKCKPGSDMTDTTEEDRSSATHTSRTSDTSDSQHIERTAHVHRTKAVRNAADQPSVPHSQHTSLLESSGQASAGSSSDHDSSISQNISDISEGNTPGDTSFAESIAATIEALDLDTPKAEKASAPVSSLPPSGFSTEKSWDAMFKPALPDPQTNVRKHAYAKDALPELPPKDVETRARSQSLTRHPHRVPVPWPPQDMSLQQMNIDTRPLPTLSTPPEPPARSTKPEIKPISPDVSARRLMDPVPLPPTPPRRSTLPMPISTPPSTNREKEKRSGFGLSWFGLNKEDVGSTERELRERSKRRERTKRRDKQEKRERKKIDEVPPPPPLLPPPAPKRKEKDTFFGGLFGKRKSDTDKLKQRAWTLFGGSQAAVPPPSESNPLRYPLHVERSLYRLSHFKLANPRRALQEQVVISNMMFWYLAVINAGQGRPSPLPTSNHPNMPVVSEYDEASRRLSNGTPPSIVHFGVLTPGNAQHNTPSTCEPWKKPLNRLPVDTPDMEQGAWSPMPTSLAAGMSPWGESTSHALPMPPSPGNASALTLSMPGTPNTQDDYDLDECVLDDYYSSTASPSGPPAETMAKVGVPTWPLPEPVRPPTSETKSSSSPSISQSTAPGVDHLRQALSMGGNGFLKRAFPNEHSAPSHASGPPKLLPNPGPNLLRHMMTQPHSSDERITRPVLALPYAPTTRDGRYAPK
ncbi:hypothetical protein MVES1_001037 [Malassezia vespertilionis]|uniref:Protein Zds1 C-terminal domain-containing protein n=1 Tax=Malassezia vespertilionis TaxID=2020962 RepID=A0A2N1JF64_9BASI|nr:uncharacterized protein MVES1_001037 [Malassezia vespertilionis]PKI85192.1 hypothetical protein MVES_000978 [Malassezia vespertilionis]WFD05705.1 hypothetical protein MVES1_001037 [Malassezia vespertilionis]